MRIRPLLNAALIAAVSIFFMSGCGFFKKESRRIITDTHWGGTQGPTLAQKAKPAPKPQPAPDPKAAEEGDDAAAEGAEGAEKTEGDKGAEKTEGAEGAEKTEGAEGAQSNEMADTDSQATASTANIGSASPKPSADKSMTLYVAYQEAVTSKNLLTGKQSGALMKSQVRVCKLQKDNSLQCNENKKLNRMLNPHLEYK
jgi:hypothetical protein